MFLGLPGGSGGFGKGVGDSQFWTAIVIGALIIGGFAFLIYTALSGVATMPVFGQ